MRTPRTQILILMMSVGLLAVSQTPEQQKMMEEMEKNMAEGMRMRDSLMNTPDMKNLMGQIQGQEENNKAEREKENALKQEQESKIAKNRLEDFYWRNTIASDTNGKFSNWSMGAADFGIVGYPLKDGTGRYKFIKMGTISAEGKLTYDLPKEIPAPESMQANNNLFIASNFTSNDFQITGGDTGFISSYTMTVFRDNKKIGNLYIGSNIKVAKNLASPCCNNYGDEGYRIFWSYADANCRVHGTKNHQGYASYGELEKKFDRSTSYDLEFKPGWNLIKTESIGYEVLEHYKYAKVRKNTLVQDIPSEAKYFFESYEGVAELKISY